MKKLSWLALVVLLGGCSVAPTAVPEIRYIEFPNRAEREWEPSRATKEAEEDIKNDKVKIYISGTIAPYAPGVKTEAERALVKHLPRADAGVGCVITNEDEMKFRQMQAEYAERYNKYVVNYFLQK